MAEVEQLCAPLGKAIDLAENSAIGCRRCDRRACIVDKTPVAAILRMRDQITFSPPIQEGEGGFFVYHRQHTSMFKYFPSCQREALGSARRVIQRLNQFGGSLALEATYKLRKNYLSGKSTWFSPFDKQHKKLTYLPMICILSLQNEQHGVRMALIPNKTFISTQNKPITFNDCVQTVPSSFPKPMKFALQDIFCLGFLQGDVQAMFNSIRQSLESSLNTLSHCLRTPSGLPTYSLAEAEDDTLHCLRSKVLDTGMKDSPFCAQQALSMSTKVYRQYHPEFSDQPMHDFLLNCVDKFLSDSVHMDDICGAFTVPMLIEYASLAGVALPLPSCQCEERVCAGARDDGNKGMCPSATITDEMWSTHCNFTTTHTNQFLITLAGVLCNVLNFAGFKLKFLSSPQCDQQILDNLILDQTIKSPSDYDIGVSRPKPQDLRDTISKMKTHSDLQFQRTEAPPAGQVHLSHSYTGESVQLNIKHITMACLVKGKKTKSVELYSFEDYLHWKTQTQPTFTKRTLFSLLHQNYCFTGKWLSLYKAAMKILIRSLLIKTPNMHWDGLLPEATVKAMELAISLYFKLVQVIIVKPPHLNSYFCQHYLILFTDSSNSIMAQTITVVSVTQLHGHRVVSSMHLELNCYATHITLLSIPLAELLSLLRGVLAMSEMVQALKDVGVIITPARMKIGVDNKIVLTQVRTPANHFKKRTAHAVAKIQLLLSDLGLNPFFSIGFQDQSHQGVTFYPDLLTRISFKSSVDQLMTTYHRLMDTSWMNKEHPDELPGWSNRTGVPHLSDEDWMMVGEVLEGEVDAFKDNIQSQEEGRAGDAQHVNIIDSATAVVKSISTEMPQCGSASSASTTAATSGSSTSPTHLGDSSTTATSGSSTSPTPLGDSSSTATRSSSNSPTPFGDTSSNATKISSTTKQTLSPKVWKDSMDQLVKRFHHKGLGPGGALAILGRVMMFVAILKTASKLDPRERVRRQTTRAAAAAVRRERKKKEPPLKPFQDEHFLWCDDVDFSRSKLGQFDCLWNLQKHQEEKLEGDKVDSGDYEQVRVSEESELASGPQGDGLPGAMDQHQGEYEARALQHLLSLFPLLHTVKGYTQQVLPAKDMMPIVVLQGRRTRNFAKKGFAQVRLRPLEEDSALESLILWSMHRYSRGQGIFKAMNGLSYLNLHIALAEKKLQKIQRDCTCCCRRRASMGKTSDKIRKARPGPTDCLQLASRWLEGINTVQCDLHGPIFVHLEPNSRAMKHYVVCFLELPMKQLVPILVPSLSSADLFMAIQIYSTQRGRACDIFYSDFGANLSRFHNTFSEMNVIDEEEERRKSKAWYDMLTANYKNRKLQASGVSVRFSQGRHEVLGPVETAQFQIKIVLHSFNHHHEQPLTFQKWTFVLSCVAQVISSRPLLITEGKVYSPESILRLTGDYGRGHGHSGLTFHVQGNTEVTRELRRMAEEVKHLRKTVAEIMLSNLVKKYFLETANREQQLRKRTTNEIQIGDVFFCEKIFCETSNITSSLLQLVEIGASLNHGLFKRTSTHHGTREQYVGRGFRELYFIAQGHLSTTLGGETWAAENLPTFQLTTEAPRAEREMKEYDVFDGVERKKNKDGGGGTLEEMEEVIEMRDQSLANEEEEEKDEAPVFTRAGRQVRRPQKYQ